MLNKLSGLARSLYILLAIVAGFVAMGGLNVALWLVVLGLIAGISLRRDKMVLAAAIAFVVANSLHYGFGRWWIFRGTERKPVEGYVYFLANAGVGMVITLALFAAFVAVLPAYYLIGRVLVSVVSGLTVFVLNAVLNFRTV